MARVSNAIYAKFEDHRTLVSGEDDFLKRIFTTFRHELFGTVYFYVVFFPGESHTRAVYQ